MRRVPELDGDRDGAFERVVSHLVVSGGLAPREILPDLVIGTEAGRPVAVVRNGPGAVARVREVLDVLGPRRGEVVVVGGGIPDHLDVRRLVPAGAPVTLRLVTDDGRVFDGPSGAEVGRSASLEVPPDWDTFWLLVASREVEQERAARPAAREGEPRPFVTWALAALIGVAYLLEIGLGFDDRALDALGALVPEDVRAGAWWRLGASMFLHGGTMHILSNGYVLVALGAGVERTLGRWRYLLLYMVAGLGGGLAATILQDNPCVGASGALWGLMTAWVVVIWRVSDRLPRDVYLRMRNAAMQGIAINVVISFVPGIAWEAHMGGGVAGALVALGFTGWPDRRDASLATKVLAVVTSLFVLAGYALGMLDGIVMAGVRAAGR